MRDWTRTLRPASYKGVGFFVDDETGKSGRHVATHAYVKAESHETEDMGRLPREYRVSAYLASDTADGDAQSFVELCSEIDPGTLVLPMQGPVEVRCTLCHLKARKEKLGLVELELEFVEAGAQDDTLSPPAPIGDRLAASALGEMPDTAAARVDSLDTGVAAGSDLAMPASTDYQGGKTDAAAIDSAFTGLFG